jgi:hypothetical protein
MGLSSVHFIGFPVPLPVCRRVFGKRNWEVVELGGVAVAFR